VTDELADLRPWLSVDWCTRKLPGAIWWRLFVQVRWHQGEFETGRTAMYAGLVDRWAYRVPPFNIAVMRLRKRVCV
jgi:hypothetical protein